jgi:hypothetical protein
MMMQRINDFLDQFVLPWPVRYLSHRFVILLTISLLIPLIVYANNQVLVLSVNSYLNTMSVAVSSIVLLYATISEVHQKQIAEMQEKRAQEDHTHVVEMHMLIQEALANQQTEIENLRKMVASLQGQGYTPQQPRTTVNLRDLHPRGSDRFANYDVHERMAKQLHRQKMTERLHQEITQQEMH